MICRCFELVFDSICKYIGQLNKHFDLYSQTFSSLAAISLLGDEERGKRGAQHESIVLQQTRCGNTNETTGSCCGKRQTRKTKMVTGQEVRERQAGDVFSRRDKDETEEGERERSEVDESMDTVELVGSGD